MDLQDHPIRHLEQTIKLVTALKFVPAQMLDHQDSYESFGSWTMTLRASGNVFRVVWDGKERLLLTLQRSRSRKQPYDWQQPVWERSGVDGNGIVPMELVEAVRAALGVS